MMNDETPEKVARDMIAQADILAMIGNQPLSSLKVVEKLKKFAERILNAVKPDEHAARMEPLDPNAPMPEGDSPAEAQSRRDEKHIGNIRKTGRCVSYVIDDKICVTVTARREGSANMWSFDAVKDGDSVITGTIFGGGGAAMRYIRAIRNGIVSRAMKLHRHHDVQRGRDGQGGPLPVAAETKPTNH